MKLSPQSCRTEYILRKDDRILCLSACIIEDKGVGKGGGGKFKWWMLNYKMTSFNYNFVFLLANLKSDDI